MSLWKEKSWSPYAVGALIGVLSWASFLSADRPLGITSAFENSAALILETLSPDSDSLYALRDARETAPKIDWEWSLVVGVFLGAFLSSRLSGDRSTETVPALWRARFGSNRPKRLISAFGGGLVMILGARLAQGCTSGHGISGILQLALSSVIFVAVFTSTGIVTAKVLFGGRSPHV